MIEHFVSVERNSCLFSICFGLSCFVISFFIQPDVNPKSIPLRLFLVLCTGYKCLVSVLIGSMDCASPLLLARVSTLVLLSISTFN